jgi:DNA-binding GntR family transcriptional regulator
MESFLDCQIRSRNGASAGAAAERLRRAIVSATLTPGARLTASRLAAMLDLSRGTIRSALQRLVAEGLEEDPTRRFAPTSPFQGEVTRG